MARPVILWADLTQVGTSKVLQAQFAQYCSLRNTKAKITDSSRLARDSAKFAFLEYDYPDKHSLGVLVELKKTYPSIPIIMVTQSHSEALAVWAFRAGAWDYLTKPLTDGEVHQVCTRMQSLDAKRNPSANRTPALGFCALPDEASYFSKTKAAQALEPAITFLQSHYNEKIREERLARICGMSKFRFSRAFRECYHLTFREWLLVHRIEQAKRLLENPELSVTQVAFMVGFNDTSQFGKMFRRICGQTATDFRHNHIKIQTETCEVDEKPPFTVVDSPYSQLQLHASEPDL